MSYEGDLDFARRVVSMASLELLKINMSDIKKNKKNTNDYVTNIDLEIEKIIISEIRERGDNYSILTEERGLISGAPEKPIWILDPIDGTRELIQGIPEFVISLDLVVDSIPKLGVILNPLLGVEVFAMQGMGCYENGLKKEIKKNKLADSTVLVSRSEFCGMHLPFNSDIFEEVVEMGSLAWKLSRVAVGVAEITFTMRSKWEWDACAADIIIREAGGAWIGPSGLIKYGKKPPLISGPLVGAHRETAVQVLSMLMPKA
jgi:myo-inositol-1(or 4)-monophosphatase